MWDGRVWLFESEANLSAFQADPVSWIPQFGGYDLHPLGENYEVARRLIGLLRDNRLYVVETCDAERSTPGQIVFTAENFAAARQRWLAERGQLPATRIVPGLRDIRDRCEGRAQATAAGAGTTSRR